MPAPSPFPAPPQISFAQELARKATHMGALIIPAGYWLLGLSKGQALAIMIPAFCLMLLIDIARLRQWSFWRNFASRLIGPMVRSHEQAGDFTGASYILLSTCCTIALFDKPIAIAALTFIIVGDSLAAIIGRRFGRLRFNNKTVEGSLACLVGTAAVAMLVPNLALPVGMLGAVVATVTEAFPFGIDDNVSVPILSGLSMTILQKMLLAG